MQNKNLREKKKMFYDFIEFLSINLYLKYILNIVIYIYIYI